MAKSGRKKHLSFSPFRRRKQPASDRRFSIVWINGMVNKQVEKRMVELRSEFLLMNHALREEMAVELQEQLRELVPEEARERSLHYTKLDREQRITSRWLRKMVEEYEETAEEDDDEAKSRDLEALSFNFSETSSDTHSIFTMRKPSRCELEESSNILLDVYSDISDAKTSSQPAKCEHEENQRISSDGATVADTSQLMKESEEKRSRNPFHASPSFTTEQLRREKERVQVEEEVALLMDRQWKEWMDKQEMRGNHNKVKPVDQQNPEKQGGAAHPAQEKQMKQDGKGVDTMKKIKTYLCDLFTPHTSHKWERLEDED